MRTCPLLSIQLIGTDGSVWDLYRGLAPDGSVGVKLSDKGVVGLSTGTYTAQLATTAGADGQILQSWTENPRTVLLPVRFRNPDALSQAAFWRALSLYGPLGPYCTLRVIDSLGVVRDLPLRFTDDGGVPLTKDPELTGNDIYPIGFISDSAWWLGEEVVTAYSVSDAYSPPFFGDAGVGGPPFYIGESTGVEGAYVTNAGDVPAWLKIEAEGPLESFYLYVGSTLSLSFPNIVAVGHQVNIDTDPFVQYAEMDGNSVLRYFNSVDFRPISPGETHLSLGVSGAGRIRARFRPRYRRAY